MPASIPVTVASANASSAAPAALAGARHATCADTTPAVTMPSPKCTTACVRAPGHQRSPVSRERLSAE